jgi:hypothetical protein
MAWSRSKMNGRRGSVQTWAIVSLVGGLVGSCFLTMQLSASAGRHRLVYTDRVESGMKKEEALGIAAGAFRGMFANMLWMRAHNLKQDGKYWEAVDLSRTITKLQPRFPRVWAFHAWNLAYNISVATQTSQERWQWVNAGIRLLRDEGIPANPNDMLLHRELAWIYLHKIQMRMDDANNFYKEQFAREWTIAVGPPPESTLREKDRQKNIDANVARLRDIADAKGTIEEVIAQTPQAARIVTELTALGMDLQTEKGRLDLLRLREEFRSASRRANMLNMPVQIPKDSEPIVKLMQDADLVDNGWRHVLPHVRKRVLIDTYRMEPDRMIRYTQKYGPLDWRHPASHSIYWGARGVEMGLNRVTADNSQDFDFINTDRMVIHAIQELYRSGTISYDILLPEFFAQLPNTDFIESYDSIIVELMAREQKQMLDNKQVDMEQRVFRFYSAGYENFLSDAVIMLFRRGQFDAARKYQAKIADWKGRNQNNIDMERIRRLPIEEYVLENLKDRVSTPNIAVQEVFASLQAAYGYGLLYEDQALFTSNFEYAKRFHFEYFKEQYRITNVDRDNPRMEAMNSDFLEIAGQVLFDMISRFGPIDGKLMFGRAPLELQQRAYLRIEAQLPRDDKGNITGTGEMDKIFPKPQGYDAFRDQWITKRQQREIERGNQQVK